MKILEKQKNIDVSKNFRDLHGVGLPIEAVRITALQVKLASIAGRAPFFRVFQY